MNRQTKWTWASHDFVLIKYCCEGNSHDAMFRCCGMVGLWHHAMLASCITVGPGVMVWGPFTSLQR